MSEFGSGLKRRIWLPFILVAAVAVGSAIALTFFREPSNARLWTFTVLVVAIILAAGALLVRSLIPSVRELASAVERVSPGSLAKASRDKDEITTLVRTVDSVVTELRTREQTWMGDLAKRNQLVQQLSRTVQEQAASLETTLNSVDMAVCLFDSNGNLIHVNQRFSSLLGLGADKLKEMGLLPIVSELQKLVSRPEELVGAAEEIYRKPSVARSITLPCDGGSVRMYCAPLLGELSSLIGIVVSKGESTDASVVDRLKSEFISTVSHELRTPLTAIHGALGLVLGGAAGPVSESMRELLDIADTNANRMIQLVNDILEIFRIESGKLQLQPEPIDVAGLITRTCEKVQREAAAAGIHVETRMSAGLPPVLVDSEQVEIVLEKLISNAIKFSTSGTAVHVGAEPMDGAPELMVVWVRDFGAGIPLEAQERIFEKFEQVENVMTRQHQGPGLGLAICRGIVEGHGGRIWLKSESGKGSTFYMSLPVAHSAAVQPMRSALTGAPSQDRDRYLIMVVEDDPDTRNVICRILQSGGHFVMGLEEGSAAAELAMRHHPEVITLDLLLPGMCGLDILRALKANEQTRSIPVICVSISDDLMPQAIELGALQYIRKPVDPNALLEAVRLAHASATRAPEKEISAGRR
ncbi:MAG: response regulator [Acidobacteria bacterium]|nr:response regulator [Acidobacteriota bacterium]